MSESTAKRSSSPSSASTLTSSSSASAASSASAVATRASSATSSSSKTPAPAGGWLAEKIHNNFLTCKLCFEVYTSPKCLSCLHTFCESCIENLLHESDLLTAYRKYTASDYREVVCPICRRRTQVPLGGVRRLPDNFLIEGLSETLIRQKPPKYPLCDICKHLGKTNKDASSKCLECQRLMCQDCVLLHGQTKVTSGHTIFDVEIEKEVECKDHEDEVVRFYCDTCSACICVMCTFNEHRDHDILGFQEAALKHHGRVKNMADICKKNLSNSEKELEALESCESLMNSVEQFIKSKAEEMLNEVKFREKLLIEQLKKIYGKQCLERISKKKDLILRMEECKSACKLVDAVLAGKEIEFLLLRTKVEQKLETLNKIPRKKLPATVGKVLEFRPGSLDFGYLYDYDNPRPLTKSSSLDKSNSLPDNDNNNTNDKAATKRKSKTAIEINYVTAYYGGGQIHTCSVDTQTDPVEVKVKSGEPFKVKKAAVLEKKKAVFDDISKDEQTNPTTAAATTTTESSTTSTTPTSQVSVARNEKKSSTTQSSAQVVSALTSSQQHGIKTTQKQPPTRPSSSSASASSTVKGSSTSSTSSSSSSSSMSSPQTQRNDKLSQSATKTLGTTITTMTSTQQQSTAQQQQQQSTTQQQQSTPKLRRILKHLGSSVESFSSYDEDGGVFYQEEVPQIPSKEARKPLVSISSTSSISSISSLPSPALNPVQPNLAPDAAASTAAVATAATAAVGSSLDKRAKAEANVSASSNVVVSTPQSVSPLQQNLAPLPASSTQHNVASSSKIASPASHIVSTSKIVLQPRVQQASVTLPKTATSVFRPSISASSSATSSSSSSSSLPSPSQGTLVLPASTMKINSIGQNVVAETKLQPAQQSSNKPKSTAVVVKSSASSTNAPTSSSSSSSAASSSSLPSAQKSPPMTSSSLLSPVQTQSFALPTSKAQLITSPTSSLSSSLAKPNLASIPAQTITKVIASNVASSKSSQPSLSSALQSSLSSSTSQPSSLPSSSSSSSSTSKPQAVPTTMQVTPSGGLKIVATVTPTLTSATKLTSSSSPSVTSLSQAVVPPSVENDGKVATEKSEVAAASAAATASTTSTANIATESPAANEVVYRKRREKGDKEMTHLSDSPLFKHSYLVGETKHGAAPSRHNSLFYPSYLRHSHVPPTSSFLPSSSSSSGAPASSLHRMSDGSLYGHHKFF